MKHLRFPNHLVSYYTQNNLFYPIGGLSVGKPFFIAIHVADCVSSQPESDDTIFFQEQDAFFSWTWIEFLIFSNMMV